MVYGYTRDPIEAYSALTLLCIFERWMAISLENDRQSLFRSTAD